LCKGYLGACEGFGVDPLQRHTEFVERALPAMFPAVVQEKVKQAQRKTVDRLRDAEGRFVSPSRPSRGLASAPAPAKTEEEMDAELVAEVDAYLKKTSGE
jgi:hypothetical protein